MACTRFGELDIRCCIGLAVLSGGAGCCGGCVDGNVALESRIRGETGDDAVKAKSSPG